MKNLIMVALLSLLFIGCDKPISMQDIEKAKIEAEQNKKQLTDKLIAKFDSEYNHIEFCNKYGALYYVNNSNHGYVISAPVLDKDSRVISCDRNE